MTQWTWKTTLARTNKTKTKRLCLGENQLGPRCRYFSAAREIRAMPSGACDSATMERKSLVPMGSICQNKRGRGRPSGWPRENRQNGHTPIGRRRGRVPTSIAQLCCKS